MKKMLRMIAKVAGIAVMALAFLQWLTFDYPDVNPFWPGAIFVPGMVSQFINYILVTVIGSIGFGLFKLGKAGGSGEGSDTNDRDGHYQK